jgi:hypothetical protein
VEVFTDRRALRERGFHVFGGACPIARVEDQHG